jgi:hypothetical protein
MEQDFFLPSEFIGQFAVVKLWPEIKTAEDECISRLKITASILGLKCLEIHPDGRFFDEPDKIASKNNVDFVLHLHYDTPKFYDAFSFVALWNPTQFYHEWGYARTSRNLLTHDDFLSCSSSAADDHVSRLVRKAATHLPPFFNLYHSVADIVRSPSLGERKLFYVGINWEAVAGKMSRHQELLKLLDETGNLLIFGPRIFQGVKVWKGYKSYVREIPFDGVSVLDEISKAGIALVLSSKAHKDSELMSNRLMESVAAGALVICDENNFAKKFFGDSLLYIDSRYSVDKVFEAVSEHLVWVNKNPGEALKMVAKSQEIFREKFSLKKNLIDLYYGLSSRKLELLKRQIPENETKFHVRLYFFVPEFTEIILNNHISSIINQEYSDFLPVLIIDKTEAKKIRSIIEMNLQKLYVNIELLEINFFDYGVDEGARTRRKIGKIIDEVLKSPLQADAVMFVAPNEKIFSNHLTVLAGSLIRNKNANCASAAVIFKELDNPVNSVHERIDFSKIDPRSPIGYARFIFRVSSLSDDLSIALPYLDRKSMAVLIGNSTIYHELPSTVIIDVKNEFPSGTWDESQENEIISSYCPNTFGISLGHEIVLPQLESFALGPNSFLRLIKLLQWRWIFAQIMLLRRHGVSARMKVLKRKLNNGLL